MSEIKFVAFLKLKQLHHPTKPLIAGMKLPFVMGVASHVKLTSAPLCYSVWAQTALHILL